MLLKSQKFENFNYLLTEVISEIFKVSLIAYLSFYLIDSFANGFVTNFFNLNILLYTAIITGVLTAWIRDDNDDKKISKVGHEKQKPGIKENIFIIFLGIAAGLLIYYKIKDIGWIAFVISPLAGIIIILI